MPLLAAGSAAAAPRLLLLALLLLLLLLHFFCCWPFACCLLLLPLSPIYSLSLKKKGAMKYEKIKHDTGGYPDEHHGALWGLLGCCCCWLASWPLKLQGVCAGSRLGVLGGGDPDPCEVSLKPSAGCWNLQHITIHKYATFCLAYLKTPVQSLEPTSTPAHCQ